jgi:hypothetical protein
MTDRASCRHRTFEQERRRPLAWSCAENVGCDCVRHGASARAVTAVSRLSAEVRENAHRALTTHLAEAGTPRAYRKCVVPKRSLRGLLEAAAREYPPPMLAGRCRCFGAAGRTVRRAPRQAFRPSSATVDRSRCASRSRLGETLLRAARAVPLACRVGMRSRRGALRGLRENGAGALLRFVRDATIGCDVAARVRRNREQDPECRQCSDDETLHGVLLWRRRQGDCVGRKASAVPLARPAMRCPNDARARRGARGTPRASSRCVGGQRNSSTPVV